MKDRWMSIGFDEELQPYQEPERDLSDVTLLGNTGGMQSVVYVCHRVCGWHHRVVSLYACAHMMHRFACIGEHFLLPISSPVKDSSKNWCLADVMHLITCGVFLHIWTKINGSSQLMVQEIRWYCLRFSVHTMPRVAVLPARETLVDACWSRSLEFVL